MPLTFHFKCSVSDTITQEWAAAIKFHKQSFEIKSCHRSRLKQHFNVASMALLSWELQNSLPVREERSPALCHTHLSGQGVIYLLPEWFISFFWKLQMWFGRSWGHQPCLGICPGSTQSVCASPGCCWGLLVTELTLHSEELWQQGSNKFKAVTVMAKVGEFLFLISTFWDVWFKGTMYVMWLGDLSTHWLILEAEAASSFSPCVPAANLPCPGLSQLTGTLCKCCCSF